MSGGIYRLVWLVMAMIGLMLVRVFLPDTGWLTDEGIQLFPWFLIPLQGLVTGVFIWEVWQIN